MNIIINEILGWLLITGTIISYTPQYYKIYQYKTSKGISEWMLIYGGLSCLFNVIASIEVNRKNIVNCNTNNDCYNVILPIIQLGTPWLTGLVFYGMYVLYYNEEMFHKIKFHGQMFIFLNLFVFLITFTVNYISFEFNSDYTLSLIYSILSSIFCIIMWIPQIITTYNTKEEGALSLISVFIHALGCLITIIYQTINNASMFWVITSYVISFVTEIGLVILCLYYKKIKKNESLIFKALQDENNL